jgi:preprotein translocase subunit SecG
VLVLLVLLVLLVVLVMLVMPGWSGLLGAGHTGRGGAVSRAGVRWAHDTPLPGTGGVGWHGKSAV